MIIHVFLQKVNTGVRTDSWNERNVPYLDCSDGFMNVYIRTYQTVDFQCVYSLYENGIPMKPLKKKKGTRIYSPLTVNPYLNLLSIRYVSEKKK